MIDGIKLMQNENGEWAKYDDTYDVVIHCESAEEQERAINILKDRQWISVRERLPECGVPVAVLLHGQYPEDVIYEARKKLEKIQWGKDICAASGEDTDDLPEEVFLSVAEKLEDRMLENNGDLEYAVVQEVVNEFREQEEEDEID